MIPRVPSDDPLLTRHTQMVASILNGLIRNGDIEIGANGEWRLYVEKRFRDGPQAFATSNATIFTGPSTGCTIQKFTITNRNAAAQTYTLCVGNDLAASRIAEAVSIAGDSIQTLEIEIPLAPSGTIDGLASSTDVNVMITGVITQTNAAATIT